MTWNNQLQAFVESKIPMTYNPQIDAWEDSTGHTYNQELGAWEKVWPDGLYLYTPGNKYEDVTGGFVFYASSFAVTETDEYIQISHQSPNGGGAIYGTAKAVDLTSYKTLHYKGIGHALSAGGATHGGAVYISSTVNAGDFKELYLMPADTVAIVDVDVSNAIGLRYVGIGIGSMNSTYMKMYELWLE